MITKEDADNLLYESKENLVDSLCTQSELIDDLYSQLKRRDEAITELEEAMKPKTCDGCKFLNGVICKHDRGLYCVRQFEEDYFQPKDNA